MTILTSRYCSVIYNRKSIFSEVNVMFKQSIENLMELAMKKKELLDNSIPRYLLAAGLAGAYVGLGIILIFSVGAPLFAAESAVTSMVMGMTFGIALTLVIFAGAELFTGNNMYYTLTSLSGKTTWRFTLKNWFWCYLGNFAGAMVLVGLVAGTGLFAKITPDHLLFAIAAKKMNLGFAEAFFRGILCNWLVCLSIWTANRAKEDIAKLVLIWWMLFAFIASGYEHSVANMTVLGLALALPHPETVTIEGWFQNMIPVTLGNIVGGVVFLACAYWLISPVKAKDKKTAEKPVQSSSLAPHPKSS